MCHGTSVYQVNAERLGANGLWDWLCSQGSLWDSCTCTSKELSGFWERGLAVRPVSAWSLGIKSPVKGRTLAEIPPAFVWECFNLFELTDTELLTSEQWVERFGYRRERWRWWWWFFSMSCSQKLYGDSFWNKPSLLSVVLGWFSPPSDQNKESFLQIRILNASLAVVRPKKAFIGRTKERAPRSSGGTCQH